MLYILVDIDNRTDRRHEEKNEDKTWRKNHAVIAHELTAVSLLKCIEHTERSFSRQKVRTATRRCCRTFEQKQLLGRNTDDNVFLLETTSEFKR